MTENNDLAGGLSALIIYWSGTGNTEKVSVTIQETLEQNGAGVTRKRVEEAADVDLYGYDLVFLGAPAYTWLPPKPVMSYIDKKHKFHRDRGDVKLCAPKVPGRRAVVFCTYSGPHSGIREAIPTCLYMGQLFEHLGFEVFDEWYVVGEFHGSEEHSTLGCLGDIRGSPNRKDLDEVRDKVITLLGSLQSS